METTSSGLLTNGGQDWHEVSGQPFGWFIQRTATAIPFRLAPLAKGYSFNASASAQALLALVSFGRQVVNVVWSGGTSLASRTIHFPVQPPLPAPASKQPCPQWKQAIARPAAEGENKT